MNETFSPEEIVAIFRERDIDPDETFTAAAGADHGHVAAWDVGRRGYVLAYGDGVETDYDVADDADDLRAWLIHELDDESAAIEAANIDGAIDACDEDAVNVAVMVLRSWYGPRITADLLRTDDGHADVRRFATAADAQGWIDDAESSAYTLAHNEASSPSYVIVQA